MATKGTIVDATFDSRLIPPKITRPTKRSRTIPAKRGEYITTPVTARDRIGLHHKVKHAHANHDTHRKQYGQDVTVHTFFHIIGRTTAIRTIGILFPEELGQGRFGKADRHAQESCHPHPKDGTGTTGRNGRCNPNKTAGSYLPSQGGAKSCKPTDTTGFIFITMQACFQVAK